MIDKSNIREQAEAGSGCLPGASSGQRIDPGCVQHCRGNGGCGVYKNKPNAHPQPLRHTLEGPSSLQEVVDTGGESQVQGVRLIQGGSISMREPADLL